MTSRLRALKASNLILGLANLDYELLEKVADIIEVEIDAALDVVKDDVDAAVAEERERCYAKAMDMSRRAQAMLETVADDEEEEREYHEHGRNVALSIAREIGVAK